MTEWRSSQRSAYRSPLVEFANINSSVKGRTKSGIAVQAQAASPSNWVAFTYCLSDVARCGSKPARRRRRAFFTKERIRNDIPEEPALRDRTRVPLLCLDGLTDKFECTTLRTKSARPRLNEKAGSISNTRVLLWPVRGDMHKRPPTKPVWGRTAPVYSVELSGCAL